MPRPKKTASPTGPAKSAPRKTTRTSSAAALKATPVAPPVEEQVENLSVVSTDTVANATKNNRWSKPILAVAGVVLLAGLLYYFRSAYLVAVVNNQPIFRYQLNQKLTQSQGKTLLESMIVEHLVNQEAAKNNIVITDDQVKKEIDTITASLGEGTKIEDVLSFQGMTMDEFKEQLRLRLSVTKLLEKDIAVTADEVDQYVKDNGASLTATTAAEKRTQAETQLKEQKLNQKIQSWLADLQAKAKIVRFLK